MRIVRLMVYADGQQAFRTHHNYIQSLKALMTGCLLSYTDLSKIRQAPIPLVNQKRTSSS
jgi:hypothetical protein